ncbi:PQQ-dependent sugar dehydrogenase [Vibrio sp. MA40-2]|uniref:PQQ-dependent sugar dehydrogenase n=1 Tax=Vibrio sp. MA40-2 TaxID=3391828 RepID=UPI0039A48D83
MKKRLNAIKIVILIIFSVNSVQAYEAVKIAEGMNIPWGLAYIDQDSMLVTEKSGTIKHVNLLTGKQTVIANLPEVWAKGQGGLLDIARSPFKQDQIYVTYSKNIDEKGATALATARYSAGTISDWKTIFVSISTTETNRHFGSRIAFDDSHVYFSIGDRGERDNGQDLTSHAGSIVRLNPDGSTPSDNPFIGIKDALEQIWSYGHRNPQGLYFDSKTQNLWSIEHGPRGGDEINLINKANNYGWPITSHGKEYWGPISVGESTEKQGITSPTKVYIPSIAPSSLLLYRGTQFPKLNGKLLSSALKAMHINVVTLDAQNNAVKEERILVNLGERIRDIETSPSGELFFSTDNGNLYKLAP